MELITLLSQEFATHTPFLLNNKILLLLSGSIHDIIENINCSVLFLYQSVKSITKSAAHRLIIAANTSFKYLNDSKDFKKLKIPLRLDELITINNLTRATWRLLRLM
jgi:hypothetical protein